MLSVCVTVCMSANVCVLENTEWHSEYVLCSIVQRVNVFLRVRPYVMYTTYGRKLIQNNSYSVILIIFEGDLNETKK